MLRPTTLCRATPPFRQLLMTSSTPISSTPIIINQTKTTIIRTKTTTSASKRRLEKKSAATAKATPEASPTEPAKPLAPRPPPPFIINRTPSKNLPVYIETKRGGNKKLTLIRKLEGDRVALAQWLADDLGLDRKQIRVKSPTNHVELDGDRVTQVKQWFEARGF